MSALQTAPRALTTKEAACRLGVSRSLLEKLRVYTPEKSPPFFRLGKSVRYRDSDLDAWASARIQGGH